jgi:hypothetical protein
LSRLQRILFWLFFIGLAAASCWGVHSARLFARPAWTPIGLRRLLLFAGAYLVWSTLIIGLARRWFLPLTSLAALVWVAIVVGPHALLAVAMFLLSCAAIGRLIRPDASLFFSQALGMCVLSGAIGAAIYLPINYPAVYLALFALPLTVRRITPQVLKQVWNLFRPGERGSRTEYAAAALLGFAFLTVFVMSLQPETGADALSMHLFIPWSVYFKHYWSFDFQLIAWALMPMGADWSFTGVFLLGGESAAKLLNFGALAILGGMVYEVVRRWLSRGPALLCVALFVSSPLVLLVTGSVFVENIQAAFLFGALTAFWEYRKTGAKSWLFSMAALLGGGMATKLGSLAFVAPCILMAGLELWRQSRRLKRNTAFISLAAVGIFLMFALPPYVTAYVKSGNPVFPFLNHIFKSPAFDSRVAFIDGRWRQPLTPGVPFDVVFHTRRYFEGDNGGLGFQYFLLVPLCVPLLGRRWPYLGWTALGMAVSFALFTFSVETYVRYLYAALPLATIVIGLILARLRSCNNQLFLVVLVTCVMCQLANTYLLPAASPSHAGFSLIPFAPEEAQAFDRNALAVRRLVRYLNEHHPNQAVGMFETAQTAGLLGDAYADNWHYFRYSRKLHETPSALGYLRVVQRLGIRHFIVPVPGAGTPAPFPFIESFLTNFTEPECSYGAYAVAGLKEGLRIPSDAEVAASLPAPGPCSVDPSRVVDDLESRIHYAGRWAHAIIYPAAFRASLSYTEVAEADFQIPFSGTEMTWVHTQAPNRGQADVEMDGVAAGTVDLYTPGVHWQAMSTFRTSPGSHTFRVKVRGNNKAAMANRSYVDIDCLIIR